MPNQLKYVAAFVTGISITMAVVFFTGGYTSDPPVLVEEVGLKWRVERQQRIDRIEELEGKVAKLTQLHESAEKGDSAENNPVAVRPRLTVGRTALSNLLGLPTGQSYHQSVSYGEHVACARLGRIVYCLWGPDDGLYNVDMWLFLENSDDISSARSALITLCSHLGIYSSNSWVGAWFDEALPLTRGRLSPSASVNGAILRLMTVGPKQSGRQKRFGLSITAVREREPRKKAWDSLKSLIPWTQESLKRKPLGQDE